MFHIDHWSSPLSPNNIVSHLNMYHLIHPLILMYLVVTYLHYHNRHVPPIQLPLIPPQHLFPMLFICLQHFLHHNNHMFLAYLLFLLTLSQHHTLLILYYSILHHYSITHKPQAAHYLSHIIPLQPRTYFSLLQIILLHI